MDNLIRILFKKEYRVPEIICENLPRYGVVVVVVIIETADTSEAGESGIEISDMFLKKCIVEEQMYKLFWNSKF